MRLLNYNIFAFNQPAICRDGVSLLDLQHVSHYYLTWWDFLLLILSHDSDHVLFQKVRYLLATTIKPKSLATPQDPIQQSYNQYDDWTHAQITNSVDFDDEADKRHEDREKDEIVSNTVLEGSEDGLGVMCELVDAEGGSPILDRVDWYSLEGTCLEI